MARAAAASVHESLYTVVAWYTSAVLRRHASRRSINARHHGCWCSLLRTYSNCHTYYDCLSIVAISEYFHSSTCHQNPTPSHSCTCLYMCGYLSNPFMPILPMMQTMICKECRRAGSDPVCGLSLAASVNTRITPLRPFARHYCLLTSSHPSFVF